MLKMIKIIRTKEILCFFTKAKNDKIGEADDKSIKNCDDKVTESKNDKQMIQATTINIFRLRRNITKQTNHNMTTQPT